MGVAPQSIYFNPGNDTSPATSGLADTAGALQMLAPSQAAPKRAALLFHNPFGACVPRPAQAQQAAQHAAA